MKKQLGMGQAAEFLKRAAAALRGKAAVLKARLLLLASLRRRAAVVAGVSRHVRALVSPGRQRAGQEKPASAGRAKILDRPLHVDVDEGVNERAAATPVGTRGDNDDGDGDGAVGMAELASLFQELDEEERHGHGHGHGNGVDGLVLDDNEDGEPSVIDVIRTRREGEGREFRIDDEIDRAADMFITRVRRRRIGAAQQELL